MALAGVKVTVVCAQEGGIRIERAAPHTSEAVSKTILFFVIVLLPLSNAGISLLTSKTATIIRLFRC
jgi:hypothetical protein